MPAATWWAHILGGIHAPDDAVNQGNLNAWQACEGATAAYNPFNTTEPWPGATDYNSVGVKNYPSFLAGVSATIATLENGNYPGILAALRSSAGRAGFAGAVGSSPGGPSGTCLGGASGVAPPPGNAPGPGGPPGLLRGAARVREDTRQIARATRDTVWLRMYWRTMGVRGWPR